MVAYTLCRGPFSRRVCFFAPGGMAHKNFMEQRYLVDAIKRFVSLMGTDPFATWPSDQPGGRIRWRLETGPKKEGGVKSRYEGSIALSVCVADCQCHRLERGLYTEQGELQTLIMMLVTLPGMSCVTSPDLPVLRMSGAPKDESGWNSRIFSKQAKIGETGTNRIPYGGPFDPVLTGRGQDRADVPAGIVRQQTDPGT